MPKTKTISIPISAIAKLSSNISRPTLYKIVRTKKDIVKILLDKEKELTIFYDEIFAKYKKNVYREKRIIRDLEKKEMLEMEKKMKANQEKLKLEKLKEKAKVTATKTVIKTKVKIKPVVKKETLKVTPKVKIKTIKEKNSQKSKQSV